MSTEALSHLGQALPASNLGPNGFLLAPHLQNAAAAQVRGEGAAAAAGPRGKALFPGRAARGSEHPGAGSRDCAPVRMQTILS